jgi:ligand-binding sensor domain-containing protein
LISRPDARLHPAWRAGFVVLTLWAQSAWAQASRNWRPDDRVLITAFAEVGAIAQDQRHLYAATSGGLTIYDYVQQRWLPPSTLEDGYPPFAPPTALAVDVQGNEVWLGTARGSVLRWRGLPPRWEIVTGALLEPVLAIVPINSIADDAIYIQTRSAWHRARRLSFATELVPPPQVPREALQRAAASRTIDPELAALRARIGVDPHARRWPITATIPVDRPNQYWFGTRGAFLFGFDAIRMESNWLWFGAPTRGVTALAIDGNDLWLGGDGRGPRGGVVRATRDLQRWSLFDPLDRAPDGRVVAIAAGSDAVYFASDRGVYRFEPNAREAWQRFPIDDPFTLAALPSGVWVGTQHGIILIREGQARSVLVGPRVVRITVIGDSVWAATNRGLLTRSVAAADSASWDPVVGLPAGGFVDAAGLGQTRYALAPDALYTRTTAGWSGPVRTPAMNGLGRLRRLLADDTALWIAGERGIARYVPAREEWLYFLTPGDIPEGPITDLAVDGSFVWLATPAGALRLPWRAP